MPEALGDGLSTMAAADFPSVEQLRSEGGTIEPAGAPRDNGKQLETTKL